MDDPMTDPVARDRPDLDAIADDVRYAGGGGTSDYWRGFNDGIDRLRAALEAASGTPEPPRRFAYPVTSPPAAPGLQEHQPGEPHRYRVQCRDCGVFGSVVVSIEPQHAALAETPGDEK
jgi:hypothetical protein